MSLTQIKGVLKEVAGERVRQHEKWGEQNHPDGTYLDEGDRLAADVMRDLCEQKFADGEGTWRDILDEEIAEAYAECRPERLRAELLQVAAVAVAWVEAIDRRNA